MTTYSTAAGGERPEDARRQAADQQPREHGPEAIERGLRLVQERLTRAQAHESAARAAEERARVSEDRARAMEYSARQTLVEAQVQFQAQALPSRQAGTVNGTGATGRADRAAAVREHELARMRAKLINGETAGPDLAERLRFAHQQNGKISLDALGHAVGYSKATLSKVFNGRMPPTWALVRKLGIELNVPPSLVQQEWLPLWIAADNHRQQRKPAERCPPVAHVDVLAAGPTTMLDRPLGHTCPKCGSWVVDATQHTGWHMAMEPGGEPPDTESLGEGWNSQSQELNLLRAALGPDAENIAGQSA